MEIRTCKQCGTDKEITKFHRDGKGNPSNKCEACRSKCRRAQRKEEGRCGCGKPLVDGSCPECNSRARDAWHRKRLLVLKHYGGDPPRCQCPGCNVQELEFLTIEHVGNWGLEHRKQVGRNICSDLIRNNFPDGITILCYNCNCCKGKYGYCPHEKKKAG
jgi:hypothetical protein